MWSVGCIMGELILNAPLLQGKYDIEQIHKIFSLVGSPTEQNWPKHTELPNLKRVCPCLGFMYSGGSGFSHAV